MSRSLSPKLRAVRSRVLEQGAPEFVVVVDGRLFCECSDWNTANEEARMMAYSRPGSTYYAQERRVLEGLRALRRSRSWTSCGVTDMTEIDQ